MGNPKYYTTYLDEGYNGRIAKICRGSHRMTWEQSVFSKFASRYNGGLKIAEKKRKHKVGVIRHAFFKGRNR